MALAPPDAQAAVRRVLVVPEPHPDAPGQVAPGVHRLRQQVPHVAHRNAAVRQLAGAELPVPEPLPRRRSAFMPLLSIAMAEVPVSDAGLGSGITNVSQQVAGALGLAVLGTVATNHTKALVAQHHGLVTSLIGGYHLAFVIGTVCVAPGIVTALALLRSPETAPAEEPNTDPQPESVAAQQPVRLSVIEPRPEVERQAA